MKFRIPLISIKFQIKKQINVSRHIKYPGASVPNGLSLYFIEIAEKAKNQYKKRLRAPFLLLFLRRRCR
ncbi:hypothetical protein W03_06120 [Nitrosomonas sp. PY1]|nr:hypothetical protein W03_06120 [Nitrosomonas sp. PY1]